MLRSMFSGVSGLRTHQSRMDVIGNNIANVNTAAYKSGAATFQESIYQTLQGSSAGGTVYGGSNPNQVGYGSQTGSISINFNASAFEPTGLLTHAMIDGQGFFMVGPKSDGITTGVDDQGQVDPLLPNNIPSLNLTRVGKFSVDGDGYLCMPDGNVVYGYMPKGYDPANPMKPPVNDEKFDPDPSNLRVIRVPSVDDQGEVHIPPVDGEPQLKLKDIAIGKDGMVTGTADDGKIYKIGQVAVCNVPNPNGLENQGGGYYKVVNNTGEVSAHTPGAGTTGKLQPGGLEMSNVDLATEFSNMITTQRGFQACSKIISASDEMLQDLISMKR